MNFRSARHRCPSLLRWTESVLAVLREIDPDLPFSCEEGFCGTCETPVLAGTPDHRDTLLTPEERADGTSMMICVSRARSPRLTLDL